MISISRLRKEDPELYDMVKEYECTILVDGNKIYEGKYTESIESNIDDPSVAVVMFGSKDEFKLYTTIGDNVYVEAFESLSEGKSFDEFENDPSLYNKAMNLANYLPYYNLDESCFDASYIEKFQKRGLNFRKLCENFILLNEEDGDGLPSEEDKEEKEKLTERGEIKFTIWTGPDKKVSWLDSNTGYQKIEYVYRNQKDGMEVDFLLGYQEGTWKLWVGKVGSVSYDDDPYCDLKKHEFKDGILAALDKVQELIAEIKENPSNWVQFFVNF